MKKRMIAWLLCACMTFTAAPEMLLADVAAKGQQTQEDEKSAGTGQTETETDRLEEEDQNSEKLTEEKSEGIEIGKTEGIEIGKSKGIEIGRDKAMAEFVCNMIKYGFSIEKIAEVTGKNAEQIQTILNQQAP